MAVRSALRGEGARRVTVYAATIVVGAAVFAFAYDGGGFAEASRNAAAIGLWWAILVCVAFGAWPAAPPPRDAVVAVLLLAAFTAWTLASLAWADSAENAFTAFNRASLYLAALVLGMLACRREGIGRWLDGIALGATAIAFLALGSRLFPGLVPSENVRALLPAAYTRLAYPVGYWNGLGIFIAFTIPLLLRVAVGAASQLARVAAVAAIPPLAASVYLTSSRGGVAAGLVGVAVFAVLTTRRWRVLGAVVAATPGCVLAVLALVDRSALVNHPFSDAADHQRGGAALLIAGGAAISALAYWALPHVIRVRRLPPYAGRAAAGAIAAVVLVAIVAAHPVARFDSFRRPPSTLSPATSDPVRAHLLSGNGSGRWQFWASAWHEFKSRPLIGRGAGSYEAWWAQHGSLTAFVQNAHSLYLEVLGELGIVGFALLAAFLLVVAVAALRRAFAVNGEQRVAVAATAGAVAAFLVGAGIDWMWQLPALTVPAFVCMGLLVGPATEVPGRLRLAGASMLDRRSFSARFGTGFAVVVLAWALICTHAIPLLAGLKIRDSQDAAADGAAYKAVSDAIAARNIEPWAASPYVQLALVTEAAGALRDSRRWVASALRRDPSDWRLWLLAARIETKSGQIRQARRSIERARELNPRSPLFRAAPASPGT